MSATRGLLHCNIAGVCICFLNGGVHVLIDMLAISFSTVVERWATSSGTGHNGINSVAGVCFFLNHGVNALTGMLLITPRWWRGGQCPTSKVAGVGICFLKHGVNALSGRSIIYSTVVEMLHFW